jgi:Bacterial Ig domain/Right handed beta helix region
MMKKRTSAVKILPAVAAVLAVLGGRHAVAQSSGHQYYVAPNGSASNPGTITSPLSLDKALSSSSPAVAGDTIWVRGGTYSGAYVSYLTGSAAAPIVVRNYNGERAILDANNAAANSAGILLSVFGANTWFWGLEITDSNPNRVDSGGPDTPNGVYLNSSSNIKFINMIVHDMPGQGMGLWAENTDAEVNGCLVYYNGTNHWDHGIYLQNKTGTKTLKDNILLEQASHGIHAYGSDVAFLDNITLNGNTVFESGGLLGGAERNILLGGLSVAHNPVVTSNYTYFRSANGNSNIGYSAGTANAVVTNNYFIAGNVAERFVINAGATVTGNFFEGDLDPSNLPSLYPSNTYVGSKPTSGSTVFVRPNQYETGRANITVYNWSHGSSVSANLSSAGLASGDGFEIRDAFNYFGSPVVTGTYTGSPVSIPMGGLSTATPIGNGLVHPIHTAPEFGAFILLKTSAGTGGGGGGGGDTTAPTVSITAPTGGAQLVGSVNLTATAADNVGVAGVQFQIDGTNVGTEDTAAPYTISWSSTNLVNGTHAITAIARDAAGNHTSSAAVSVTIANPPAAPKNLHIVAEAESAALVRPMTKHSDPAASNGVYIATSTDNSGSAAFTVNIPSDGTYVIWGRIYGATDTSDSFFVSVDGSSKDIYDVAEGRWAAAWQWTVVNGRGSGGPASISPRLFYLTAGTHKVEFDGRETGTRLDKIEITNDLQYVPQ